MKCDECGEKTELRWTPIGNLCIPCLRANNYTIDLSRDPGDKTQLPDGVVILESPTSPRS